MNHYRSRIIEIACSQVGKRGPYCDHGILWCGAFVCWVLREAGLAVGTARETPGYVLCSALTLTDKPEDGDILRHSLTGHCGIIVPDGTICGGMSDDWVMDRGLWLGKAYSVDDLIRAAEMSGGMTGDIL